jgi:hypothetical protein
VGQHVAFRYDEFEEVTAGQLEALGRMIDSPVEQVPETDPMDGGSGTFSHRDEPEVVPQV